MNPKINYSLLGEAVRFYTNDLDYTYVEVPWLVGEPAIRATLPEGADFMQVGTATQHRDFGPRTDLLSTVYDFENALVGSAEQGFITLNLAPGQYVGVTPCFRIEAETGLFYQDTFMKVELFVNRPDIGTDALLKDAKMFFRRLAGQDAPLREVQTSDGLEIYLGDVEIGSYGVREHPDYGRWVYGTGLALPRFSVADALAKIC